MTAYQITSMMEGVVQRGTATVVREVGKPIAGKTGTTNEEKDVWFIGFSPDIVCGVYLGLRQAAAYRATRDRRPSGRAGGKDFLKVVLADKPPKPFRVPPGIKLIRVDAKSGMRAGPGDPQVILEAFKPGTAPPDSYSVIGAEASSSGGAYVGFAGFRRRRGPHRHRRPLLKAFIRALALFRRDALHPAASTI